MRRLLPLLLLLLTLPASAGLFDQRPAAAPLGAPLNNSADFLPVHEAFKLSLVESTPERVKLRFVAAEGYYLYRHRLQFSTQPDGLIAGEVSLPQGQHKTDEFFGDVEVYYEVLDVDVPVNNPNNQPFNLTVGYQGCADKGLCYPPESEVLKIGGGLVDAGAAAPASSWQWRDLALFFLAGLGLTFTPCVLPMLPILSGVVLRGRPSNRRGLVLSLAYVLPMAACYAVLGALMGLFGASLNLQAMLQSPWILVPFAAFFSLFAAAMFGVFELRLPAFIRERLDRKASQTQGGSIAGAATLGVLSSLIVSPCITAPLTALLLYISSTGDAVGGGLQLFALGLGMGTPLVLFGAGGGALLPKSGNWMVVVRNAFGVMLLAVSIWLLERVLPGPLSLALWGLLAAGVALFLGALEFTPKSSRSKLAQLAGLALLVYALAAWTGALRGEEDPLRPLGHAASTAAGAVVQAGNWQTVSQPAELDAALASAAQAGQPLLLDWYADWCISCKVIEREVLNAPAVGSQLGDYRLIRFDMTDSTPAQRALLDRYQLFGPPAIQLFAGNGQEWQDLRVVGEINARDFAARLEQARTRF
ncbi:MAG: protein-disulfide reductase DsbD [Gammaproteobacteria bacterium]|nr:protein-disulfide reductase DsbD [Gammaproteobacteria bacterium]MBU2066974.1 protein-disulfide reductase DsbD [Gammaproteobacteria bacterium]MBU2138987.1 protein-disulfide reductase DsbD [Gammaproteobacteria bacterium]MBU2216332.1 protein-disulfide reductase DsbD [Gammaproteobacteria bacterium]